MGWNLGVSPDDRLYHIGLCLRIQFRYVRQRRVIHVVLTSAFIVSISVTFLAIANRMVSVVAGAFGGETDADRRLVCGFTVLT